jgi:hypothetical protein
MKGSGALAILMTALALATVACTQSPGNTNSEQVSAADSGLPSGFQSYTDPSTSGRLIVAKTPAGAQSARALMRDSLAALKTYFDGPIQLQGAVSDPRDQVVQAIVATGQHGQALRGVATAAIGQAGSVFGLVIDRPDLLKTSFPVLSHKLSQQMPRSAGGATATAQPWRRQSGGDGTCRVDLPEGWNVKGCQEGVVTVVGPHKELIQLGLIFFVSYMRGNQGMSGPYLQPVPAFSYFVNYFTAVNRMTGVNVQNVPGRVLEVKDTPAPMPNGKGAYLLQEVASNGQPAKVFALVYTVPNLMAGWTLYASYVSAPAALFAGEFADLMRIWSSWKVDDVVYQRQMQQTLQSMNATRDILSQGTEHQMHAYDNLQESMGLIIRGEDRLENKTLGGRADVYTQNSDSVLRSCRQSGYQCQAVPFNELAAP